MDMITQWDLSVLDAIAAHRIPALNGFFSAITALGNAGIVWIVLAAALLCFKKTRPAGICVALALILNLAVSNGILKPLVARVRPYALREVTLLVPPPDDASFPSGHASSAFAAVAALWRNKSRLTVPALILAALISFSRLYLYLHFPTDVLAGAIIGAACGLIVCALWKKIEKLRRHI